VVKVCRGRKATGRIETATYRNIVTLLKLNKTYSLEAEHRQTQTPITSAANLNTLYNAEKRAQATR